MTVLAELHLHESVPAAAAADVVEQTATSVGVLAPDAAALGHTVAGLVTESRAREWFGDEPDPVTVTLRLAGLHVQVGVRDTRMPIPAESVARHTPGPGPVTVERDFAGGNVVTCSMPVAVDTSWLSDEPRIASDAERVDEAVARRIVFRAAEPDDARAIARLAFRCYGYTHALLINPDAVARALGNGTMVSQLAVHGAECVGHVGYVADDLGGRLPELGRLIVDPRFRGHHLAETLMSQLLDRGRSVGVPGFWAEAVANHAVSQAVFGDQGAVVVGALLDAAPAMTMAGMAQMTTARQSLIAMILPLRPSTGATAHLPSHLHATYNDLIGRLGLIRRVVDNHLLAEGSAQVRASMSPEWGVARLTVLRSGSDGVERSLGEMAAVGGDRAPVRHLDVPLGDPIAPGIIRTAEEYGYSWAALLPDAVPGGDVLRLQQLSGPAPDLSRAQCATEHARAMLDFTVSELHRVSAAVGPKG